MNLHSYLRRMSDRIHGRRRVHFLHIGKTGGTALVEALRPHRVTKRYSIVLHDHRTLLRDVPVGDFFVFFVRSPLRRFVSGFISRQRQGRPRYHKPWNEAEQLAFSRFKTPNELAHALEDPDANRRAEAQEAMRSIHHVQSSYWDWFESEAYFRSRLNDLFFMGRQESLSSDFLILRAKLGLPESAALPDDDVRSHRTVITESIEVDEISRSILTRWYARDLEFMELCRTVKATDDARAIAES